MTTKCDEEVLSFTYFIVDNKIEIRFVEIKGYNR